MEQNQNIMPSPFALIKASLVLYKRNYKFLMALGLVPFIVGLVENILSKVLIFTSHSIAILVVSFLIALFFSLIGFILQFVFQISLIKSVSEIDKGNTVLDLKSIYKDSLKLFFPYLWISILATASTFIPLMVFIIPGLILSVYLSFAVYALVIDNQRGLNSLSTSFYYVKNNWWKVFGRSLSLIVVGIFLAVIVAGIFYVIMSLAGYSNDPSSLATSIKEFSRFSVTNTILMIIFSFITYTVMYPLTVTYSFFIYKYLKLQKPVPKPEYVNTARTFFKVLSIISAVIVPILLLLVFAASFIFSLKTLPKNPSHMSQIPIVYEDGILKMTADNPSLLELTAYVNTDDGFSIRLPKGWEVKQNSPKKDGTVISPKDKNINGLIQIQTYKLVDSSDTEIEREMKILMNQNSDIIKNPKFSKLYIGSNLVHSIHQSTRGENYVGGFDNYLIPNAGLIYIISFGWNAPSGAGPSPLAYDSISTFTILK